MKDQRIFSESALQDLKEIIKSKIPRTDRTTPLHLSPKHSMENLKLLLSRRFEKIYQEDHFIRFSKKKKRQPLSHLPDREPCIGIAWDFVKCEIPGILCKEEIPTVLSVKEKKEKNNILFLVRVGRIYKKKPIFNSLAEVEIDPFDKEILSFSLEKWYPVVNEEEFLTSSLSEEFLKGKIKEWIRNRSPGEEEKGLRIKGINQGWMISGFGELSKALLVYGTQSDRGTPENEKKEVREFQIMEAL